MRNLKTNVLILMMLFVGWGSAQTIDSLQVANGDTLGSEVTNLGEVKIVSFRQFENPNRIQLKDVEVWNRNNVAEVIQLIPGVNMTKSGARNETMVTVRGFDLRQIPVYIDGIPVYIPYDGIVDLARFTTSNIEKIDISKGYSSITYGPNSLGGAINLISSKPKNKLEIDGTLGLINTDGYKADVTIGSRINGFYIQGNGAFLQRNDYVLSKKFVGNMRENGGKRENSYYKDWKVNFKVGWNPNENHEYVVGYINQQGSKGNPIYSGRDTLNKMYFKPRYWQWPKWNKETYYFISNSKINENNYIKSRVYFDQFTNSIYSYDDSTYSTLNKPSSFQSFYNDYSVGGNVEYGTKLIPKNELKFAFHYKMDVHREHNLGEPIRHFNDHTISVGVEDVYEINDKFTLTPGFSYSLLQNNKAEDFDSKKQEIFDFPKARLSHAYNGQLIAHYRLNVKNKLGFAVSAKTRCPTFKDRYSYKMGTAIPNPNLNPETSYNAEMNYHGKFVNKIDVQAALFYSYISNVIMSVDNVKEGKSQMLNRGYAQYYGVELGLSYHVLNNLKLQVNHTFIKRENLSDPSLLFTNVPEHSLLGIVQYRPFKSLQISTSYEFNSGRYSSSYGTKTKGFHLLNLAISAEVTSFLKIELGVNNILDTNYEIDEGYPEEGRHFFVTLRFHNLKIK